MYILLNTIMQRLGSTIPNNFYSTSSSAFSLLRAVSGDLSVQSSHATPDSESYYFYYFSYAATKSTALHRSLLVDRVISTSNTQH